MIMVENCKDGLAARGRPQIRTDEETRARSSRRRARSSRRTAMPARRMCAVAQRAGVSTKTLYRLIPTKADLFESVISDRIGRFMLEIDETALDAICDTEQALERCWSPTARLTLDSETIAIIRLVLGECERFPEIGEAFYEAPSANQRGHGALAEAAMRRGLIALEDPPLGDGHAARHDDHGAAARRDAGRARRPRTRRSHGERKSARACSWTGAGDGNHLAERRSATGRKCRCRLRGLGARLAIWAGARSRCSLLPRPRRSRDRRRCLA